MFYFTMHDCLYTQTIIHSTKITNKPALVGEAVSFRLSFKSLFEESFKGITSVSEVGIICSS